MEDRATFASVRDLFVALCVAWVDDLFPERVTRLPNGRLAVPAGGFRQLSKVAELQRLDVRTDHGRVQGEALLTADLLLGSEWVYRDPLHWNGNGSRREELSGDSPRFDRRGAHADYLLGANTRPEAAQLLDRLMAHMSDGVEVTPLAVETGGAFSYLWLVSGHRPPLDLLRAAPRAWWGPIGQSRNACVFAEWPWSLAIEPSCLQRIPWKAGKGFVLLSHDEPRKLIVSVAPDRLRSLPLEVFSDLQPVAARQLRVSDTALETRFPVELSLRDRTAPEAIQVRIGQLQVEIAARQLALGALESEMQRLHDQESVETLSFPEPLLLYYGDGAEVPDHLRRLLIEWSNQPGDLDALRCARFDTDGFPDRTYPCVHAVTTASVIDGAGAERRGDPTLPIRLQHYIPHTGAMPCFEQLTEWAPFGLRLFVPRHSSLILHPRLRPGEAAADKLAKALYGRPVTRAERARALILLVQGGRDRLVACHIPAGVFTPLTHAFDWQCAVNVNIDELVHAVVVPPARARLVTSLGDSLEAALSADENRVLATRRDAARQHLEAQAALLADYDARADAKAQVVAEVEPRWRAIPAQIEALGTALARIEKYVAGLVARTPQLEASVSAAHAAAAELDRERLALAETLRQLQDLQRRVKPGPGDQES